MPTILISVLLIVEVLSAFLLIVVILAQKSKDQGLGMAFGGGMGESLFGSRAGNVLTRMTVMLAVVFMLTTMALGFLFAGQSGQDGSVMTTTAAQAPLAPVAPAAATTPPQAAPAPMMMDQAPAAPAEVSSEAVMMEMGDSGQLSTVEVVEEVAVPEEPTEAAPQE
jgi:preprotein translocase subunit SecG